jgi:hypothetical protein
MRYLNKIIFINSAIKYAEIVIDGNVHFTGTQGAGKSTLLRAILFFYNGDTQKLGIKIGQKSFSEYYFPSGDSYIIYEITKETGSYSVLCYKHLGKICFRFFDSIYIQKLFVNENNKAYESWEKIKEQLNKNQIASSNKVERFDEYRDILYGNNDGKKEFRKYALLESKQYQNIPRTIQNVLLNAELKAEFIKETIIKSLIEDDISIDLGIHKHELKTFDAQLTDIKKWTEKNKNGEILVKKQALEITNLHYSLKHLEREKYQFTKQLAWVQNMITIEKPKLENSLTLYENKKEILLKQISEINDVFQKKTIKTSGEITVLKTKIEDAKKKQEDYEKQNINTILERVSKKQVLIANQTHFTTEKTLLSSQFSELTQRFEALLNQVKNQKEGFENLKKQEKNAIQFQFLSFKENLNNDYQNVIKKLKEEHKERLEAAKVFLEENRKTVSTLINKKIELKHKRYYDAEIEYKKAEITELKNLKKQYENQILHFKRQVESIEIQFASEEKSNNLDFEREAKKQKETIERIQLEITVIDFKIENSKDSLFGWLNENYSDWEKTIGKVIADDDTVLFHSGLTPKLIAKSNSFYGVELNLNEINKTIKTVADYKNDKEDLLQKIAEGSFEITELEKKMEFNLAKLKSKYQLKTKEFKTEIKENTYHLEQNKVKQEHARIALSDLENKANTEKQNDLISKDSEIQEATSKELNAKNSLTTIEQNITKLEKEKEKEKIKETEKEQSKVQNVLTQIDAELKMANDSFTIKENELKQQQNTELTNKGADTNKIILIENEITAITNELEFIDANTGLVERYKYDKVELFDKVSTFQIEKEILEKSKIGEEEKHKQQKVKQQKELADFDVIIADLTEKIKNYSDAISEYDYFVKTEIYQDIPSVYKEVKEENKTTKSCKTIINDINLSDSSYTKRLNELKDVITGFTGNFSVNNIFKFKTNCTTTIDYLQFSEDLNEFIEEDKISEFEKRVNEQFSGLINSIGKETANLMSKGGEIQKTITKINNDFIQKGSFVKAIKKIELQWKESSNQIVGYLLAIQQFNNENQFLGNNTLFATNDMDKKNKQAIDLLKALLKTIDESKKDKINLSDSFELQFRIVENQNDTGWIEKLSNVGSDGTDILVKAMINIMLLNVSKEEYSKKFKDFRLHCMMDEIGKLHSTNVNGILKFANERNILLINGSPEENNALGYKHIYHLYKDEKSYTKVKRLITNFNQS